MRKPDLIIGPPSTPYLLRWHVLLTPWFRVYLHKMLRDDDDRALHDHPWSNVSIILRGGFVEVLPSVQPGISPTLDIDVPVAARSIYRVFRRPGSFTFRRATDSHRLELPKDGPGYSWSLFITGAYQRRWGFHCPKGWRSYRDFVNMASPGEVGPGCG